MKGIDNLESSLKGLPSKFRKVLIIAAVGLGLSALPENVSSFPGPEYSSGYSSDQIVGHPVYLQMRSFNGAPIDFTHWEITPGDGRNPITIPFSDTNYVDLPGPGFAYWTNEPITYTVATAPFTQYQGQIDVYSNTGKLITEPYFIFQDPEPEPSGRMGCVGGCDVPTNVNVSYWEVNQTATALLDVQRGQNPNYYSPNAELGAPIVVYGRDANGHPIAYEGIAPDRLLLPAIIK